WLIALYGVHHTLYGDVLVVTAWMRSALVLKWHGGESVAPRVLLGKGHLPELVGRGVRATLVLFARLHIGRVESLAVRGVCETKLHLVRVDLRLGEALSQGLVPGLGLEDSQLPI